MQLTRTHRILIGVVVAGAVVIAAIGFAGSYAAVRELAQEKGFGKFSLVFPIGIDAGICVLLALDLLLTWIRIPFPLLRQAAWILTTATIAFNGAAAWPDPLGVGMHAVIPLLFIVAVEAARHAVGRIADITADKHMEGVRLTRWVLSPIPTFMLWRRMKLWELRSYEQVIKLEQDRLIYQSRLQARFGRSWKRKAPIESLMPLRLAKYGVPLADTAPAGLAAAGIEPVLLPPAPKPAELPQAQAEIPVGQAQAQAPQPQAQQPQPLPTAQMPMAQNAGQVQAQRIPQGQQIQQGQDPQNPYPQQQPQPQGQPQAPQEPQQAHEQPGPAPVAMSPWFAAPKEPVATYEGAYDPAAYSDGPQAAQAATQAAAPQGPGRRPLGGIPGQPTGTGSPVPPEPEMPDAAGPEQPEDLASPGIPEGMSREEAYYDAFRKYVRENNDMPNARQLALYLVDLYGVRGRNGGPLAEGSLKKYLNEFPYRFQAELDAEHIA